MQNPRCSYLKCKVIVLCRHRACYYAHLILPSSELRNSIPTEAETAERKQQLNLDVTVKSALANRPSSQKCAP
jgi:hypothetical protein